MEPESGDLTLEGLIHDLNNVFETVSEAADLLKEDPNWTRLAATIQRSVTQGQRIIGSFTATALGPQDFDTILHNAIEFARDLLKAMRAPAVRFTRDVEPDIVLRGSSADWERVLLNLFVNAAQAMKQGGVIEVSAHRNSDGVHVCVADNGPGIDPAILPRIFTARFSTKSGSGGLGLHIVKSIVNQNGGTVAAANREEGGGAAFSIFLPHR